LLAQAEGCEPAVTAEVGAGNGVLKPADAESDVFRVAEPVVVTDAKQLSPNGLWSVVLQFRPLKLPLDSLGRRPLKSQTPIVSDGHIRDTNLFLPCANEFPFFAQPKGQVRLVEFVGCNLLPDKGNCGASAKPPVNFSQSC